jgi:hypothetical protein
MRWRISYRNDDRARPLADRHYNRQKVGSPGFVPPGRCLVLLSDDELAVWVTSWPDARYVQHAWAGAWVNSLFRREGGDRASELIRSAVAASCSIWTPPQLGLVTFVDPSRVPGVMVRGRRVCGYCYQRAGFEHVGFTKGGLWAWQLLPAKMPQPEQIPILT